MIGLRASLRAYEVLIALRAAPVVGEDEAVVQAVGKNVEAGSAFQAAPGTRTTDRGDAKREEPVE
jgi:hypothetical protein